MNFKRVISFLLALVLVLNVAPMQGFGVEAHDHDHDHDHVYEENQVIPELSVPDDQPTSTVPENGWDVKEEIVDGVYHYCGVCGDDLTWKLNRDTGVLTISGTGEMWDYSPQANAPWEEDSYWSLIVAIVLEEGVTSIGDYAFSNLSYLENVTIPESVKRIGYRSFRHSSIRSVYIPAGVIEESAFERCTSLTSLTVGQNVTQIGEATFKHCADLVSVTIEEGATTIGDQAFAGCLELETATTPKSVTELGDYLFKGCPSIKEVTIGGGVIRANMFAPGKDLHDRTQNCLELTKITIGANVTDVEMGFFPSCEYLEEVVLEPANPYLTMDSQGVLYNKAKTRLLRATKAITGAYEIASTVTSADDYAFLDRVGLTSVTLPAGLR